MQPAAASRPWCGCLLLETESGCLPKEQGIHPDAVVILGPVPRTTTQTRLPVGFAGVDPPARWPRPRSAPRSEALALGVETLPGVGPTVRKRLAKLGLRTVGDLLGHRPRRYERPVDEKSIAQLFGDEEAVIEGTVGRASGRRRGRLHILTATVSDATGSIKATWFNQPWLEARLQPGTHVRLRGKPTRYGFNVDSYDFGEATETADFAPVYPGSADIAQKQLRGIVASALPYVRAEGDPLPAGLLAGQTASAPRRRARRAAPPALARGGGGGPAAPRLRRAADAPARAGAPDGRARVPRRGGAACAR